MPLFSRKKTKSNDEALINTEDEVLGYLDEVYRKRIPLTLRLKGKSADTDILYMDEKNKVLRVQQDLFRGIQHGMDVSVGFPLDRTWWTFKSKFVLVNEKPHILIPKAIHHSERRKHLRTSFTPREQVKVTVLEGLGSGNGVFGMAVDIGTGGISLTIEKAMNLSNEREIPPTETLFKPGTKLAIVKINRLPGCPLMEVSGIAKRVWRDGKWRLAIEFANLPKGQYSGILRFIEPRTLEFKPVRRSKKRREEREEARAVPRAPAAEGARPESGGGAAAPSGDAGSSRSAPPADPTQAAPPPPSKAGESAPEPAKEQSAPEASKRPTVLVLGEALLEEIPFLKAKNSPFEVIVSNTPISAVKVITEDAPAMILCGTAFKGRNIVEVLEKIHNMGVLNDRKVVVCGNDLTGKDMIKLKMLKIETVIPLPMTTAQDFLQALSG